MFVCLSGVSGFRCAVLPGVIARSVSILVLLLAVVMPVSAESTGLEKAGAESRLVSVNINTAPVDELAQALDGVGLKRAQAIVAYRQQFGDFTTADQLLEIKGIGVKVLAKNQARILLQ